MIRKEISDNQLQGILDKAVNELLKNGLKSTTMDSIASALKMSKRTLYEIFENKDALVEEAFKHLHKKVGEHHKKVFEESDNTMEAIVKCFLYNRDFMRICNIDMMRDMDTYIIRMKKDNNNPPFHYLDVMVKMFEAGAREGYFRNDINFRLQIKLLTIQMESLKRMEENFPSDITLLEAYDSISLSFLRAIASQKGLQVLDSIWENIDKSDNSINL